MKISKPSKKVSDAVTEYTALAVEIEKLEKRRSELKPIISEYLEDQPEQKALIAGFQCTLVEMEKESFSLKAAKEKIDGRILAPYISLAKYTQIRTSWKGGEAA